MLKEIPTFMDFFSSASAIMCCLLWVCRFVNLQITQFLCSRTQVAAKGLELRLQPYQLYLYLMLTRLWQHLVYPIILLTNLSQLWPNLLKHILTMWCLRQLRSHLLHPILSLIYQLWTRPLYTSWVTTLMLVTKLVCLQWLLHILKRDTHSHNRISGNLVIFI